MPVYISLHKIILTVIIFTFHYYLLGLGSSVDRFYTIALKLNAFMAFFFILSGFLIAKSLHHKKLTYGKFVSRRILRLYPLYAVSFLICYLMFIVFSQAVNEVSTPKLAGYFLVGLSGIIGLFPSLITMGISGYLWSMTPELIAAFLVFPIYHVISATSQSLLKIAALALFTVLFSYPLLVMLVSPPDIEISVVHYPSILLRLGEIILGLILGSLTQEHMGKARYWFMLYAALLILFFTLAYKSNSHSFFYEPLTIAMACCAVITANLQVNPPAVHKIHPWIADLCYGFYLIHIPVLYSSFLLKRSLAEGLSAYLPMLMIVALFSLALIFLKTAIRFFFKKAYLLYLYHRV